MSEQKPQYRWAWQATGRRMHIVSGGVCASLCGKWAFLRGDEPVGGHRLDAAPEDCKECVKRWNKMFPEVPK